MTAAEAIHAVRKESRKRYKQVQGSKAMRRTRKREKRPEKNHSARQGILRRPKRINIAKIKTNRSIMNETYIIPV